MKNFIKIIATTLLLWFIAHSVIIVLDGLNDEKFQSDVAVILGNTVNPDGSLSERLKKRLDKGLELYKDSIVPLIVVSGGLGKEGYYEGAKMAEYLVEKGVPKEAVIIDNEGNTTGATLVNFKNMDLRAERIIVVSQFYHITRTKLAFTKLGFRDVQGVHADYFEWRDLYSIFREFFGYYKYLLFN